MKIVLKDKKDKITRTIIMIQRDKEILFTTEDGKPIATLDIDHMYLDGDDTSPHPQNFYLTFTAVKKCEAVQDSWCGVGVMFQ